MCHEKVWIGFDLASFRMVDYNEPLGRQILNYVYLSKEIGFFWKKRSLTVSGVSMVKLVAPIFLFS